MQKNCLVLHLQLCKSRENTYTELMTSQFCLDVCSVEEVVDAMGRGSRGGYAPPVAILTFTMSQSSPELIYKYNLKHFN